MPLHMYLHICYFFNTGEITLDAIFCNKLFYLIWREDLFYIGLAHCFLQQHTILLYALIDIITFLLVILSFFFFYFRLFLEVELGKQTYCLLLTSFDYILNIF